MTRSTEKSECHIFLYDTVFIYKAANHRASKKANNLITSDSDAELHAEIDTL